MATKYRVLEDIEISGEEQISGNVVELEDSVAEPLVQDGKIEAVGDEDEEE